MAKIWPLLKLAVAEESVEASHRQRLATTMPWSRTGPSTTLATSLCRSQCRPFTASFTLSLRNAVRVGTLVALYDCPSRCFSSVLRMSWSARLGLKCCSWVGLMRYVFSIFTLGLAAAAAAAAAADATSLSIEPRVIRRIVKTDEAMPLNVDRLLGGCSEALDLESSVLQDEPLRSIAWEAFLPPAGVCRNLWAVGTGLEIPLWGQPHRITQRVPNSVKQTCVCVDMDSVGEEGQGRGRGRLCVVCVEWCMCMCKRLSVCMRACV